MDPEKKGAKKGILKKINLGDIFIVLVILLGIVLIINILITYNLNKDLKKGTEAAKEKLKPAKIELLLIRNSECSDCFDISAVPDSIRQYNVNVTAERILEFDSNEGKKILRRYKVGKVPAVIVTGEIEKVSMEGFEKKENALLLAGLEPPYTDAVTGEIRGRVVLYNLKDSGCEKCNALSLLTAQIKGAGVKIYQEKNIEPGSDEGKELIKKYSISFVPAIILSKDASEYDVIQQAWPQIGSRENDGAYVLRLPSPPFVNLTTGKLRGVVDIAYLTDKSCAECYDVSQHKEILTNQQSFAVRLGKEEAFDISDAKGKELIAKYNITQAPAIILSGEISVYPSSQLLKQFFSVEKDGSYVFRMLSAVGTYKDLTKNEVVKIQQQSQEQ